MPLVKSIKRLLFVIVLQVLFNLCLSLLSLHNLLLQSQILIFEFHDQIELGIHVFHPLLFHLLHFRVDLIHVNFKFILEAFCLLLIFHGVSRHLFHIIV